MALFCETELECSAILEARVLPARSRRLDLQTFSDSIALLSCMCFLKMDGAHPPPSFPTKINIGALIIILLYTSNSTSYQVSILEIRLTSCLVLGDWFTFFLIFLNVVFTLDSVGQISYNYKGAKRSKLPTVN